MEAEGAHNHPNRSQQTPRAKTRNRETEKPMEPETEILSKNKDVNANPVSMQPQSRYLLPQSRPMTSMHVSTTSPQLATNNAAITNQLKLNTINTQPHNATLTQP